MDEDVVTDAVPLVPQPNRRMVYESDQHKMKCHGLDIDRKPETLEQLTEDDIQCIKMLWAGIVLEEPNEMIETTGPKHNLFDDLYERVNRTEWKFNCILIETLVSIKRFDLLKLFNLCQHNAIQLLETIYKGAIRPTWKRCFARIDECDDSDLGKKQLKTYLVEILKNNEDESQTNLLNAMSEILDQSFLNDVKSSLYGLNTEPYPMNKVPCGICLIINNKLFKCKKYGTRDGTDADADALFKVFIKFGFIVIRKDDQTSVQIKDLVKNLAEEDHSNYNCLICCVLSHGEPDAVVGTDGNPVHIENDIVSVLNFERKFPRLFFIQACQRANSLRDSVMNPCGATSSTRTDSSSATRSDELVCLSTIEGGVSARKSDGSWYIQTLVKTLETHGETDNIFHIMTIVSRKVRERVGTLKEQQITQQPIIYPRLRGELKFKRCDESQYPLLEKESSMRANGA